MPKETFFNLPDEKRTTILDLAIEEFAHHDYKNASISHLVTRAGIAKGSFYQYFEDKRDLYLYLIQLAGEEKKRFLEQKTPPNPGMHLFDFLKWAINEGARFEFSNPLLAQVAYRALFSDRPFGDDPFNQLQDMVRVYYLSLVQMGKSQGVIDTGLDNDLVVFLLSTIFNNFGKFILERQNIDSADLASGDVDYRTVNMDALSDQLISILKRGLAPRD